VLATATGVEVGTGGRTNAQGAAQLAVILGVKVTTTPVEGVLHLKTALTALPDGSLVEANTVDLGGGRVLVAARPRDGDLVAAHGFEPVPVGIGEFEKLEGGVTCLSVRARRTDRQR
jgi:dimethylargininase